jgi:hypothetical protein
VEWRAWINPPSKSPAQAGFKNIDPFDSHLLKQGAKKSLLEAG